MLQFNVTDGRDPLETLLTPYFLRIALILKRMAYWKTTSIIISYDHLQLHYNRY